MIRAIFNSIIGSGRKLDFRRWIDTLVLLVMVATLWSAVRANRLAYQSITTHYVPWISISSFSVEHPAAGEMNIVYALANHSEGPACNVQIRIKIGSIETTSLSYSGSILMPQDKNNPIRDFFIHGPETEAAYADVMSGKKKCHFVIEFEDALSRKYSIDQDIAMVDGFFRNTRLVMNGYKGIVR